MFAFCYGESISGCTRLKLLGLLPNSDAIQVPGWARNVEAWSICISIYKRNPKAPEYHGMGLNTTSQRRGNLCFTHCIEIHRNLLATPTGVRPRGLLKDMMNLRIDHDRAIHLGPITFANCGATQDSAHAL